MKAAAPAAPAPAAEPAAEMTEHALAEMLAQEDQAQAQPEEVTPDPAEIANPDAESAGAGTEEPPADEAAEKPEDGAETEVLSQAAEEKTEEAEAEAEAEPKAPRISDALDEIASQLNTADKEVFTDEHRQAVNEVVNQVVRDRVGKVSAKLAAARTEAEEAKAARQAAEARVQELEAGAVDVSRADNPLGHLKTEAEVQKATEGAESAVEDCENLLLEVDDNPQWVIEQLKASKVAVPDESPSALRKTLARIKQNAERNLRRHLPERLKQIGAAKEQTEATKFFEGEALNKFPVLKSQTDPFTVAVTATLRKMPDLARLPYGKLIVAHFVRDVAQQKAKAAAPAKKPAAPLAKPPAPKPKPQTVSTAAGKPKAAAGAKSAAYIAAQKEFDETGSLKALEKLEALGG